MTEGSVWRKIVGFAVPVFIGRLFQQLYNTADSLVVGQLVGTTALAAVSSVGNIIFMLVGFFMGFSQGAGIIISNDIGAQDEQAVQKGVHTAVAMGLVFSVIMTGLGIWLSPAMLRLLDTPADVMEEATLYLRWYFAGSTGLVMYNTFVGILQASGDSRHPLYYLIFSSVLNVALDYAFIGIFGMGVDGAALATAVAQILSACLALRRLTHTDEVIRVTVKKVRFHWSKMKQIFHYGLPSALQACIIDLSNLMIQSYINSFGSLAMAGIGAYTRLEGFSFLPTQSFSMALSTFLSQNRGAGRKDRMRAGLKFGLITSVSLVEAIGALLFFVAPSLIAIFDSNPEVVAFGVRRAQICGLFYCLLGFSHVTSAAMRGMGRPTIPTIVMLVCWCFVRVGVLMTIGKVYHNIDLVCWIYPITWGLSAITYLVYLWRLGKKGVY